MEFPMEHDQLVLSPAQLAHIEDVELAEFKRKFMDYALGSNVKKPSEEQFRCLNTFSTGSNVVIEAVAGAGKTTLCLMYAKWIEWQRKSERILHLTYSSPLKMENRHAVKEWDVGHVFQCESLHSLIYRYYRRPGCSGMPTDEDIADVIDLDWKPSSSVKFDVVILDEAQDMNGLLFALFVKFIKDVKNELGRLPKIIYLGDEMQSIYKFRGSDPRYLTLVEKILDPLLKDSQPVWYRLPLSLSQRVSSNIALYVSNVMMSRPGYIQSAKAASHEDHPVYHYYGNAWNVIKEIVKKLIKLIATGLRREEIYILVPRVKYAKENSPLVVLYNSLVSAGHPCHISERGSENEGLSKNKICISTVHGSKGCEKDCVVLLDFNDSYFDGAKNESRDKCPNLFIVAATRARKILILAGENKDEFRNGRLVPNSFQFLNLEELQKLRSKGCVQLKNVPNPKNGDTLIEMPSSHVNFSSPTALTPLNQQSLRFEESCEEGQEEYIIEVTNLVKHLDWPVTSSANKIFNKIFKVEIQSTKSSGKSYSIATLHLDESGYEPDSETNGTEQPSAIGDAAADGGMVLADSEFAIGEKVTGGKKRLHEEMETIEMSQELMEIVEAAEKAEEEKKRKLEQVLEHASRGSGAREDGIQQAEKPIAVLEFVAHYIGTAVPSVVEMETTGQCSVRRQIQDHLETCQSSPLKKRKKGAESLAKRIFDKLPVKPKFFADFLHLAILQQHVYTGYISTPMRQLAKELGVIEKNSKFKQTAVGTDRLNAAEWLSDDKRLELMGNIRASLGAKPENALWEVQMEMFVNVCVETGDVEILPYASEFVSAAVPFVSPALTEPQTRSKIVRLQGIIDVWTDENVVLEIKVTESALTLEHKLQLALYCFMVHHLKDGMTGLINDSNGATKQRIANLMAKGETKFKLLSANTKEAHSIAAYHHDLDGLVKKILVERIKTAGKDAEDAEFINMGTEICIEPKVHVMQRRGV